MERILTYLASCVSCITACSVCLGRSGAEVCFGRIGAEAFLGRSGAVAACLSRFGVEACLFCISSLS